MKYWPTLLLVLWLSVLGFAQNHLLISETQVDPATQEFIEIFNPNSFPVSLDSIYLSDYNTYYKLVADTFSSTTSDFLVRFPAGETIDSAGVIVVALDGDGFSNTSGYGNPDYEVKGTSAGIPDMESLYVGSDASLSNHEMVMMFYWDGVSDLVRDVDYVMWGTTPANFTDKTGVSIDGPDPDGIPTTFWDDTPVADQQQYSPYPFINNSIERTSVREAGELPTSGNGYTGHDETSEAVGNNFSQQINPTPGSTTLEIPTGNGSGLADVTPDSVQVDSSLILNFVIKGNTPDTLTTVSLSVPASWDWTSTAGDVQVGGSGFSGATVSVNNSIITIGQANITLQDSGTVAVYNLTSPSQPEESEFTIQTAVAGGSLSPIAESPVVSVYEPVIITPIADIQANPSAFTTVIIEGVVTLGSGIVRTDLTDAYVQDTSGRGINIFSFDGPTVPPNDLLVRGNRLRITGSVTEYQGVTEITDYSIELLSTGNSVPAPLELMTQQANNTELEGTYIEVKGEITDFASGVSGGTNIRIDDGSGETLVRVWNTTGIDLSDFTVGDSMQVRAVMDIYQAAAQLIPGYQDEIGIPGVLPGDGSGTATIDPDSVGILETVSETIAISGEAPYSAKTVTITIPENWQWQSIPQNIQLDGPGFAGASVSVQGARIEITAANITDMNQGTVQINNLTSPVLGTISRFVVKTAVEGGKPVAIGNSPQVKVGEGAPTGIIPIALIQENESAFEDQKVTIEGVVTLGAGIVRTDLTDAYVQDSSGRGINVFSFDPPDTPPNDVLKRGNRINITGIITTHQGVTEITDYTITLISTNNPIPKPLGLTTQDANNVVFEGTYIQTTGEITDIAANVGGGTNVRLDDGSGETPVRVWNTTGINLSDFTVGDSMQVRAVMDIYQSAAQLIPGYQDELTVPGVTAGADGSGQAALSITSVDTAADTTVAISMTGTLQDTIRTLRIDIPKLWKWSGEEQDITWSGSAVSPQTIAEIKIEEIDSVYQIYLGNVNITPQDTGVFTLTNLGVSAKPLNSVFWIRTAGKGGRLKLIKDSPEIRVGAGGRYLMYDLQTKSSEFEGNVTVQGVTTIGAGLLRQTSSGGDPLTTAYIQDESGRGINLFRFGIIDSNLVRGNLVQVSGTVTEFNGITEIEYTTGAILQSGADLPDPFKLTNSQVNSGRWDGTMIETEGVILEKFSAGGGTSLEISDGQGETTVRVWDPTGIDLTEFNENTRIFVRGVGGLFISRGDTIYQMLPAYQDQIERDPTYSPTLDNVQLDVEPHPFVPDRGEEFPITYNAGAVGNQVTIRIFDLAGRLVTTLLDEKVRLIRNTVWWNGRDKLLDFVPLGTYICHLEVVEQKSGKKKTKMAPIVVGTILSR